MRGQIDLLDGSSWEIAAGDRHTALLVSCLSKAMQLEPIQSPACRLLVIKDHHRAHSPNTNEYHKLRLLASNRSNTLTYALLPSDSDRISALQLMQLSFVISQQAQTRGGILLHGALAEWEGNGVILAGRSGAGKTTASRRLAAPWKSLCDDFTLIVRDVQGRYWAHPWPTWSRFSLGSHEESWNVQHAVPLKAIFFLQQSQRDRIEAIGSGRAVCLLVSSWEQARQGMPYGVRKDTAKTLRLHCFDNICDLERHVPCSILHLSLHETFWEQIEQFLL